MTVLSNKQILEALNKGEIIIDPFDPQNLSTSSYDIRLGEYYYEEQITPAYWGNLPIFNPYDKERVDRVWGRFQKALPAHEVYAQHYKGQRKFDLIGIEDVDLIILIPPQATILAHSQEFIGGVRNHTSMMKARSSFGRSFIEVCKCAGWGDIGYFNRWTMEITNNSQYYSIPLVVGRRIAQIAFLQTGSIIDQELGVIDDYSLEGKYQTTSDLQKLKDSWVPEMMLPQLYKDRDIK